MKLIAVDDVLYFQAEDKYTKVVTARRRSADQEADQGALRGARPRGVLADPSRHDRQPARDRHASSATGATSRVIVLKDRDEKLTVCRTFAHRFKAM